MIHHHLVCMLTVTVLFVFRTRRGAIVNHDKKAAAGKELSDLLESLDEARPAATPLPLTATAAASPAAAPIAPPHRRATAFNLVRVLVVLHDLLSSIRKQDSHWLVLLDEPLRGTNSGDKQAGTIGIIRNLLKLPAIGILATHDASLRTLEDTYPGKVSNFHFDSGIRGNELHFDYTLRSGCSTSNNATLLMKLNGILVDESEV